MGQSFSLGLQDVAHNTRRGIGKIAKVGIIIVVIFAALIGIGAAIGPSASTTTTASSSSTNIQVTPSTTQQTTTAVQQTSSTPIASSTSATQASEQSGPLNIRVTQVTVDQTSIGSQSGYTTYIYDVTITDTDSVSHYIFPSAFKLISTTNAAYQFKIDLAERQSLPPSITLSPGQHVSGQISFQAPNGEQPAKLEYSFPPEFVDVFSSSLPQPTRWVSYVVLARASIQGNASSHYFVSADIQNASTGIYYSTDVIPVKIALTSLGNDIASIKITSVMVANQGFKVSSVTPALPVTVAGNGQEVDFIVNLTLPQASVNADTLNLALATA